MKRYTSDDELERALFELDLEQPPADLRDSILTATIYHVPVSASVPPWEPWLYGALCAALVWLLIVIVRGEAGAALSTATLYGNQALTFFSQPTTLFWIAIGGAAAVWISISQGNLTILPGYQRATRR